MVGRKGAALSVLQSEKSDRELRYSTVQCGLRRTLRRNVQCFLPLFQKASHTTGQYVYAVGLASNLMLSRNPNRQVEDWKHFYDQVFSAVEGGANSYTFNFATSSFPLAPNAASLVKAG